MQCAACSHENRDGAKFCEDCAAPLGRLCASCGADLRPTAKFCDECGAATGVGGAPPKRPAEASGARKIVTVVFADLAGSTALHERVDAESARRLMQRYYDALKPLCSDLDIWETIYQQTLTGKDPVAQYTAGTGLRPYMAMLDDRGRLADAVALYDRQRLGEGAGVGHGRARADHGRVIARHVRDHQGDDLRRMRRRRQATAPRRRLSTCSWISTAACSAILVQLMAFPRGRRRRRSEARSAAANSILATIHRAPNIWQNVTIAPMVAGTLRALLPTVLRSAR